jgi:hypothetical protein
VEGNAGPEAGMIERNGASMMIDVRDTVTAGTHLSEVFLSMCRCYTLCYISVPRVDLLSLLPLSVRPDRLTTVYRTHFGHCRYLDT